MGGDSDDEEEGEVERSTVSVEMQFSIKNYLEKYVHQDRFFLGGRKGG